jgi:hypothetical protein
MIHLVHLPDDFPEQKAVGDIPFNPVYLGVIRQIGRKGLPVQGFYGHSLVEQMFDQEAANQARPAGDKYH